MKTVVEEFSARVIARELVTPEKARQVIEGECVICRQTFRQSVVQSIATTREIIEGVEVEKWSAESSIKTNCPACIEKRKRAPTMLVLCGICIGLDIALLLGWNPWP